MRVVYPNLFFHDGRGPTLQFVHFALHSAHLEAIDFFVDKHDGDLIPVQHLRFINAQSYMFTPEEVENYETSLVNWGATNGGAVVSLGRTPWLESFDPNHLKKCEHFRVMFYDEFLDVICEDIRVCEGSYGYTSYNKQQDISSLQLVPFAKYRLKVDRESHWIGSILDTVTPICTADLLPVPEVLGMFQCETEIRLVDLKVVTIVGGFSPSAGFGIGISVKGKQIAGVTSQSPSSLEVILPDSKLYILKIENVEQLKHDREHVLQAIQSNRNE